MGIVFYFYSNEHDPIHVHASYQKFESKAEIEIENGIVKSITIKHKGNGLPAPQLSDFQDFLSHYAIDIAAKWCDYFVYCKRIQNKKITKKLRRNKSVKFRSN